MFLRNLVPFVQFKNLENTHGGMLLLVETNTPSWVFFTSQSVSYYSMITLSPLVERNFIAAPLKQLPFNNGNLLRYNHVRFMKQLTKRLLAWLVREKFQLEIKKR